MLNKPIARQGEKLAWLFAPANRIETRKKCVALLQTVLQGKLNCPAEWAGLTSLKEGEKDRNMRLPKQDS